MKQLQDFIQKTFISDLDTLDSWQSMFQKIYPRQLEDRGRSIIGLLEELGELAESVRVFDMHPKYFLGEAADIFSYIMGIANEHSIRLAQEGAIFSFQNEFLKRYPGLCTQCGSRSCGCPSIPQATIGRMAKEISIAQNEDPFIQDIGLFLNDGMLVGHSVLETLGGHDGLTSRLPFDRGDANRALVGLCMKIAEAVDSSNPTLAEVLRSEAVKINTQAQEAGSPRSGLELDGLLSKIQQAWRDLDQSFRTGIRESGGILGELGDILDTVRVLFVGCSPTGEERIRVSGEQRAMEQAVGIANPSRVVTIDPLPAATITDFRRKLLDKTYDIIHFSGHGDKDNLVFEDDRGDSVDVPISAISELVNNKGSVKCVVLNACDAGQNPSLPMANRTIAMDDTVDDAAAIEFAKGFYDSIVRGQPVERAFEEGRISAKLAGFDVNQIKLLTR